MFVPAIVSALAAVNVKIHADEQVAALAPKTADIVAATEEDWGTEYLDNEVAMAVVPDLDAALEHIRTWSSGHTDAIFTSSVESRSEEHTSELQSRGHLVCRLLLEKKKTIK